MVRIQVFGGKGWTHVDRTDTNASSNIEEGRSGT